MRRLRAGNQRGAAAATVAILMVVLMIFAALAIDLGAAYSERQQLQNGADSAALAIARSCQRGQCQDVADQYVKANRLDGTGTGTVIGAMTSPVTVEATYTRKNWLAGIIGMPTTTLTTRASAEWGNVSGGATLPLTFSWCAFKEATGNWENDAGPVPNTPFVIHLTEHSCTPPAHNEVPGGFGWLVGVNCVAQVTAGGWVTSDPGNDGSGSCRNFDWTTLQNGQPVLVPIFEAYTGSGSNAKYQIRGIAAFTITGYCFSQSAQWNVNKCPSDKRIEGNFTDYTDYSGNYDIDPNASQFGTGTVRLTA